MHELGLVNGAPRLDGEVFTARLKAMVDNLKSTPSTNEAGPRAKVEFLYFKSCPGHKQALINLKAALRETGIRADVSTINVTTEAQAAQVGFQGSPSIRVNGKDLDGRNDGYVYGCRMYQIEGEVTFAPPKGCI